MRNLLKKSVIFFVLFILPSIVSCNSSTVSERKDKSNLEKKYKIVLEANDPKNPLNVWRIPITSYWIELSNSILGPMRNKLTPHQKAVLFMIFMNDFKVGYPSKSDPMTVVKEKIGSCGTFSNVFCALMAVNNIPCRIVSMANYPKNNGHAVAEVFYDNKWHIYDPTYAAFYTTTPNEIKNPYVLSFDELRKGEGLKPNVVRIILNPKRLYLGFPRSLQFVGPEIYVKANPAGPIGPDKPFFYPIVLDLKNKNAITEKDFDPKNQGVSYLGAAGINNNWILILSSLKPRKKHTLVISPKFLGGEFNIEDIFKAEAVSLSENCTIISGKEYQAKYREIKDWIIEFIPSSEKCRIEISHPYKGPKFFYLRMKYLKLEVSN